MPGAARRVGAKCGASASVPGADAAAERGRATGPGPLLDAARAERAAWVLAVLAPASAEALLEGLSPRLREAARAALRGLAALDSGRRQLQLARAFGERPDAERRLQELGEAVPDAMRARLTRLAPPYLRAALVPSPGAAPAGARTEREGAPAASTARDEAPFARTEATPAPGPAPHPPADALAARLLREAVR